MKRTLFLGDDEARGERVRNIVPAGWTDGRARGRRKGAWELNLLQQEYCEVKVMRRGSKARRGAWVVD